MLTCGRCKEDLEEGAFAPSQRSLGDGKWCRGCKQAYDLGLLQRRSNGDVGCCNKCKEDKPWDEFYPSARTTPRRQIWCKDCSKRYFREKRGPDGKCYGNQYTKKYRDRNYAITTETKANAGCAHCDEDDPICLEFHHEDRKMKTYDIAQLVNSGCSIEKLRAEIKKCIVLCANCHRKVEAGVRAGLKLEIVV